MKNIDLWIEETVKRLKADNSFGDMVFLKEFQTRPFEVPVKNYLVVVSLESVEKNSLSKLNPGYGNRKDSSKVGFFLYAPVDAGGHTLTKRAVELFSQIYSIGSENEDTPEMTLEPVKFDDKTDTIYREITVTFINYSDGSSEEGEEQQFFQLTVNGKGIDKLIDVECSEEKEIFDAESYLTDIPSKKVPFGRSFTVTVRKSGAYADNIFYEDGFTARLVLDDYEREFTGCIATLVKTHVVDGYVVTDIEFTGELVKLEDGENGG